MNRINKLFQTKKNNILSVYFTAGYPSLDSTGYIIKSLQEAGVDMIEVGIPFSDPMADGPVIQASNTAALKNGMSLSRLLGQLSTIKNEVYIPLLLMGYLNPVLQYGMEKFCNDSRKSGIDGIILPDLPGDVYNKEYSTYFKDNELINIFLITPQTSEERIRITDHNSQGFIYMVSSSSTTGVRDGFTEEQIGYFRRIRSMKLNSPLMAGFGISNRSTFETVCQYADGAIIGSAFVGMLGETSDAGEGIKQFISRIKK